MTVRHLSLALALGATVALAAGCAGPAASERPPDIVVVLVDTLRADHTSLHGYRRDTTPNLRRIAADGLVLRRHLVNAPWTKPSVASILTGLHPSAHGARYGHHRHTANLRVEALSERLTTLPEALRDRGYATTAWMTNAHLRSEWGFDQGYDRYVFRRRPVRRGEMPAVDRQGIDLALTALRQPGGRPAFVWLHLMAVHQYESDPEHRVFTADDPTPIDRHGRHAWRVQRYDDLGSVIADYDGAVRSTDAAIGRLYDAIRAAAPNTVLLVTSDHGEELYDHGGYDHGATLYNELLWVPAVLWGPGVPRGQAIEGLSDSLDLFPTLLRLAGGEAATSAGGGRPLIRDGRAVRGKGETFAERHALGRHLGFSLLRADGLKLIAGERRGSGEPVGVELFADGQRVESAPLPAAENGEAIARLGARIAELRRRADAYHAAEVRRTPTRPVDAEDVERLRSLGYVQ